jgi:hypothetical protein
MRSLGTRRAALVAGAATVAAVALVGCSAGQVAETSLKRPSNMGVNQDNSDHSVAIRNLAVIYNGPEGYPAGSSAPLQLGIYNQTTQPVTVLVSSPPPAPGTTDNGVVSGRSVVLVGGTPSTPSTAIPEPSGSRDVAVPDTSGGPSGSVEQPSGQPSASGSASAAPADSIAGPARITVGPLGSVTFLPGDKESLQVVGLTGKLLPGMSLNLIFEFSNGAQPLTLQAPVGTPASPASRAPGIENENTEQ